MSEKVEHTELRIERSIPQDGYECYFLYEGYRKNGMYTRKAVIEGPQTDDRTQWFESIVLACNSYPALLAERDRLREAANDAAGALSMIINGDVTGSGMTAQIALAKADAQHAALDKARAILSLLQQGEPEGFVRVPKAALDWLNGSGPDHEGKWFGEVEDALPQSKHPRKYFWRSHFRKICNAITGKPTFYTYNKSQRALVASPSPLPPAPGAEMGERKDHLADLVGRFSVALLEKLRAAEKKYGYDNGWLYDDWAHDLRRDLRKHIDKGDPLDVAAYCAFAWHHGWSTSSSGTSYRRAVLEEAAKLVKSFWITA